MSLWATEFCEWVCTTCPENHQLCSDCSLTCWSFTGKKHIVNIFFHEFLTKFEDVLYFPSYVLRKTLNPLFSNYNAHFYNESCAFATSVCSAHLLSSFKWDDIKMAILNAEHYVFNKTVIQDDQWDCSWMPTMWLSLTYWLHTIVNRCEPSFCPQWI